MKINIKIILFTIENPETQDHDSSNDQQLLIHRQGIDPYEISIQCKRVSHEMN